jgi:hypothetical protein
MSFSSNIPGLQNQLNISIELPDDLPGLRDAVNDLYQDMANNINNKEGALFVPIEKLNSGQYFIAGNPLNFRAVYRMVVDFGALPNTGTKSVPHNIVGWDSNFRLVRAYGAATDPISLNALPLPNDGIFLKNNATDVTITTTANFSAYTESTVVLEFTKTIS